MLAGCGSDSDASLTHAQLVDQANAACKDANAKVAAVPVPTDQAALAAYATKVAGITGDLESTISDLKPPKNDEAAMAKYTAGLEKSNGLLTQLAEAAKKSDAGRVKALSTRIGSTSVGVLAARAGLGTCATALAPAGS